MRFDIVSDTHGYLSPELLEELQGADYIVHAGDICSMGDLQRLERIAPVQICKGNNDWSLDFGAHISRVARFFSDGLRWEICHYRERLDLETCEIAICGHTHRPYIERDQRTGTLVMNPGSPTFPRAFGPSMGRIITHKGKILHAEILHVEPKKEE